MKRVNFLPVAFLLLLVHRIVVASVEPAETFLRNLPPGVFLQSSSQAPAEQANAIGQKLGGHVERVSNSVLQVYGQPIQLNAITAATDADAAAIESALLKVKKPPFLLRKDRLIVEYTGRNLDPASAVKASYELGLVEKPERVRYRLIAELATVDKADYMACNPLFNSFLALGTPQKEQAIRDIQVLASKFVFGRTLALRDPALNHPPAQYSFQPATVGGQNAGACVRYAFADPPVREGIPYATAEIAITVGNTGLFETRESPPLSLTASTPFWPAADAQMKELAAKITQGRTSNEDKAAAILEWLTPGKNIKYAGQTGSRWGVGKALEQKFGHCWDFSDCFITLCRAAGVPSRQVAGWLYGSSGHVWAEYYREGQGWQQVDPTGGGKLQCGIYYIAYFTSDDGEMPIVYLSMPKIEAFTPE